MVIPYRRFGTTYRSHLQGSRASRPVPEERRSHLDRGGSLQPRISRLVTITETWCVHCAVRTEYLNIFQINYHLWRPVSIKCETADVKFTLNDTLNYIRFQAFTGCADQIPSPIVGGHRRFGGTCSQSLQGDSIFLLDPLPWLASAYVETTQKRLKGQNFAAGLEKLADVRKWE